MPVEEYVNKAIPKHLEKNFLQIETVVVKNDKDMVGVNN